MNKLFNNKILDLLIKPPAPIGNFKNLQNINGIIYLSGQGPFDESGNLIVGKVGTDFDADGGYQIARRVGITMLSILHHEFGLDRIERVIKLNGFVNADENFKKHPHVINGCSDLMVECFYENGVHSRSAVGVYTLPNNIAVEIEGIFKLK